MALVCMVAYDTDENGRSEYTDRTLRSLMYNTDFEHRHRLVVVDNGSCETTKGIIQHYKKYIPAMMVYTMSSNVGTAGGVNAGLKMRFEHEYFVKCDNDVEIKCETWADELEEAIERDPTIGVLGLKRKDLIQTQWHEDPNFRSEPVMLPHEPGQRWIWVEKTMDVMGTCTMYNWRLVDAIGGLRQPSKYSFDDTLFNLRTHLAGFSTCFLPHIEIEHIDRGDHPYTKEKHKLAADVWAEYHRWHEEYINGTRPLYEEI